MEGGDGVTVEDVVERDWMEVGVVLGRCWAVAVVRVRARRSMRCGEVCNGDVGLRWGAKIVKISKTRVKS